VAEFVPPDFDVPLGLETSEFVLEPLGPEHNELDYDAWTSSMEHIAATPGYPDGSWPREMTRDENRADLQSHADDFRTRKGFTYTVRVARRGSFANARAGEPPVFDASSATRRRSTQR
jgi:hypothetical protein